MKILVTGALGFVGSNLCEFFGKDKRNKIVAIDNRYKTPGSAQNYKLIAGVGAEYDYCDIRNENDVENIFKKHGGFDVILHMAAQVAFKCSVENPRLDFDQCAWDI